MTVKSKSGNSLQFTFSNLPKDDPAYGATFYVPEDATPEQIKTRAVQIAKEFREGKTPQYIREGFPKIERASSAPPKEPPPAGTAQKTAPAAAETTAAPAQEGVKEPWQYTQKEWLAIVKKGYGMQGFPDLKAIETARANHKAEVGQAIKDGESSPPEVLADYPDLKPSASPKPASPIETLNTAPKVTIKAPKGATMVGVTDSAGRTAIQDLNPFRAIMCSRMLALKRLRLALSERTKSSSR